MSNTNERGQTSGDTEEDDDIMVLLVLYWKLNNLGCVYYLHQFRELYLLMDVKNTDLHETVIGLLDQIRPTHVILCKYNEPELTEIVAKHNPDIKIEVMNGKSFVFQKGRQELINWYIQLSPIVATEHTTTSHSSFTRQPPLPPFISSTSRSVSPMVSQEQQRSSKRQERHRYRPPPSSSSPQSQYANLEDDEFISDDDITKQALFKLSCIAPMDSYITISCVSPLFEAFKGGIFGPQLIVTKPMTLQTISLPDTMHVPSDVIQSLEIFQNKDHPSTHQKKGKEITSLYHLLNYTVSPGGTHLLKQWILRPSLNLDIINERQTSVSYFTCMNQHEHHQGSFVKKLSSYLKHVKNMAGILGHIYEHRAKISEWHQLLQFIYYVLKMVGLFQVLDNPDAPIIKKFQSTVDVDLLTSVGKYINDKISFEDSQVEGRLTIKKGVDADLDSLRSKYEALDDYLLQVAQELSTSLPPGMNHLLNVVYFPQLGYLLTVPSTAHNYFSQNTLLGSGCSIQFTTQENCYYKNDRTRGMDEQIGDIHGMVVDKQIELIQEISQQILQYREQILMITQTLAELDCIVSFSMAAIHNGYTRPQMTDDDRHELSIIQGRHPLQELVTDTFIPNDTFLSGGMGKMTSTSTTTSAAAADDGDANIPSLPATLPGSTKDLTMDGSYPSTSQMTLVLSPSHLTHTFLPSKPRKRNLSTQPDHSDWMDDDTASSSVGSIPTAHNNKFNSILLLTGANYSGKSVYLKQIGLIVYMAHIGSFVPAERSVIGLVDKLFTSIQTSESVSTAHSAFGYDLLQVSHALRYATEKSLVIMDEFGKGTNTMDGAGLFAAILNEYTLRGRCCPKVVATTHFHELIEQGILTEGPESSICFYTTEIMCSQMGGCDDDDDGKEQVVFLYRIVPGKGLGASFGSWCASLGGIPRNVLERANTIYKETSRGIPYQVPVTRQDEKRYETLNGLLDRFMAIQDFDYDTIDNSSGSGSGSTSSIELESIIHSLSSLF